MGRPAGTLSVVNRLFDSVKVKEQAYRSILSVLKLSKKYSNADLEAACALALTKVPAPRYKQLKTILASGTLNQNRHTEAQKNSEPQGYIRGAAYYGGDE